MRRTALVLVAVLAGCSPTGPVTDAGFTGDAPLCVGCSPGCPVATGRPDFGCVAPNPAIDCSACVPVCLEPLGAVAACDASGIVPDCFVGGVSAHSTPYCVRR